MDKDNIYFETSIIKKVIVEPRYLSARLDEYILKSLKKKHEGKCTHEGYIQEESIQIIKRSAGLLYGSHFTGDITYNVLFSAKVCKPVIGNTITFQAMDNNQMCVYGILGPMKIIVPREMHDEVEIKEITKIKSGDKVTIEVIDVGIVPNVTYIRITGKLLLHESKKNNNINNANAFVSSAIDDEDDIGIIPNNNYVSNNGNEESDEDSEEEEESDDGEESDSDESEDIQLSDSDEEKVEIKMKDPNKENENEEESEDEDYDEDDEEEYSDSESGGYED